MRKLLLLFSFLTIASTAFAQDPVVSITTVSANQNGSSQSYASETAAMLKNPNDASQTWSTYGFSNNQKAWAYLAAGTKTAKTYGSGLTATITTDFAIKEAINKVDVKLTRRTAGTKDLITSAKLEVSPNADMSDATEYAINITGYNNLSKAASGTYTASVTAPLANQYYRISLVTQLGNNNGYIQLDGLDYYGDVVAGAVALPTITMVDDNMVVIEHQDGGDIHYTTDGTAPTNASTRYKNPFAITEKTTVKAIAYVNGEASSVVTKTVNLNTVGNIADFITLAPTDAVKISSPVTAIYQNGRNLYLKDANDNFILAYNSSDLASIKDQFANGDIISSITGIYKAQNKLHELIPTAVGSKTAGTEVEPYEVNIADIDANMLNQYVVIENVSITADSKANNYTVTDADNNTLALYNTFYNAANYNVVEVPEGEGFTITGFISCYNTTLQITPISVTGGKVMETVATPVIEPNGGDLNIGDKIAITCATEGATIYYTTENETPSAASIPYTGEITFSEAVTIKAIAIKDGMLDSDVATATFAVYDPNMRKATFDFSTGGKLAEQTESDIAPSNSSQKEDKNNLNDITFADGYVTMTLSEGTNTSNVPRWWLINNSTNTECRTYKDNTCTITANSGYCIKRIVFTQASNDWNMSYTTNLNATATNLTQKEWTAPDEGSVNEIKFIPTGKAFFDTVTVEYSPDEFGAIGDIITDNENAPVEYYNIQGVRVAADNLTPGFYIVRQGNKTAKVLIRK